MSNTAQEILACRQTFSLINGLVEVWFDDNKVPEEYRMSIPLLLLFQEDEENNGERVVSFFVGILFNHVSLGNC